MASSRAARRVWINQAFSLPALADAIGRARPHVDLCVSAVDPLSPLRDGKHRFWMEPARGSVDYGDWILETARAQGVGVVSVQRGRTLLADRAAEFAANGIELQVPASAATLTLLDDKAAFTADLGDDPYRCPSHAVTTVAAFEDAVAAIEASGATACVKPVRGIYGRGYWTLASDDVFAHLADPDARLIAPAMFAASLRAAEEAGQPFALLVMEHLPGLEASVDIVADTGTLLLAAVRTKLSPSRQRIETRHPLIAHATALVARHRLHGAVNVQYKADRSGAWRILEINTRPAGGATYCDAVDIPFAATWIDLILGQATAFDDVVDAEVVTATAAIAAPLRAKDAPKR